MVDASVASRFLLVEDLSEEAEALLEDFIGGKVRLVAPRLIAYEVGNTLWKAAARGLIDLEESLNRFQHFLSLRIDSIELSREGYARILSWSAENDMTFYDGAYVEAAAGSGATLLTADEHLYGASSKTVRAVRLKDYPSFSKRR